MTRPDVESILKLCESAPSGPGAASRKTMEGLCRHILRVEQEAKQLSEERKETLIQLGVNEDAPQMALVYLANKVFHDRRRAIATAERRGIERDEALSKVKELAAERDAACELLGVHNEEDWLDGIRDVLTALDNAELDILQKEQELKKYRLALEGLTPGGSEFYKDPERCVAYVRDRFDSGDNAKKECVRLRRALAFKDE